MLHAEKRGTVVALGLPDEHSSHIKDKVFDQLGVKVFTTQYGLKKLIEFMDKHLLKNEPEDAFEKFV